jgi:hypothetical protein
MMKIADYLQPSYLLEEKPEEEKEAEEEAPKLSQRTSKKRENSAPKEAATGTSSIKRKGNGD